MATTSSVTLSGTTVRKSGQDIALNYILFLGSGEGAYKNIKDGTLDLKCDGNDGKVKALLDEAGISSKRLGGGSWSEGFRESLGLEWGGQGDVESKAMFMAYGVQEDKRINLKVTKPSVLEKLAELIGQNSSHPKSGIVTFEDGTLVFEFNFNSDTSLLEYTFHIGVVGYASDCTVCKQGIESADDAKQINSPDAGTVTGTTESYSFAGDLVVCTKLGGCTEGKEVMSRLGFIKAGGDSWISKSKYSASKSQLISLGTPDDVLDCEEGASGSSGTFFFLFPQLEKLCDFQTDRLCARLEDIKCDDANVGDYTALIKDLNFRLYKTSSGSEVQIPKACSNESCSVGEGYKKPIYEALVKHLSAGGFTQIVPNSFTPVEIRYNADPNNPDASESYQFVGYDLSGTHTKVTEIASRASVIYDVKNKPVSIFSAAPPANSGGSLGRLARDPITGELDYDTVQDLCFATNEDELKKIVTDSVHHDKGRVFNETVYANVLKENVWKMAEIWRQTARLTLNAKNVPFGTRPIYNEKILGPGGVTEDAYVFGTELELEKQLYSVFENYMAAAGYKIASKTIDFTMDVAYSNNTSNSTSGASVQTASGTAKITVKDIINLIRSDNYSETSVKDQITLDMGKVNIMEGSYNVHDIKLSYGAKFWNNWSLDFGFDPFVDGSDGNTAWDTFSGSTRCVWDMKDGSTMTVSASTTGQLGLNRTWRIDPKDPESYAQKSISQRLTTLEGAMIQSGFIYDPATGKTLFDASLSKQLSKAVSASISMTSAKVTHQLTEDYGSHKGKWYGNVDLAWEATFGIDYKDKAGKKSTEEEEDSNGSWINFKKYASANLDLSIKKNLLTLGNNLGTIAFEATLIANAGQVSGVIKGISMQALALPKLVYDNDHAYGLFGLPMNIHPRLGGAIGFSLHKVESSYFGSEYEGYNFSVGVGMFGIDFVLHSRKKVIQQILQRKKYGANLPFVDFLGWGKEETDEDYVARAWPCIVYNVINWAREDYRKPRADNGGGYDEDMKAMALSIWKDGKSKHKPGNCNLLKNLPDVGINFTDFYRDNYKNGGYYGYTYLDKDAGTFYNGYSDSLGEQRSGPYEKDIYGVDRWVHWLDGEDHSSGRGETAEITFPEKSNAPDWWMLAGGYEHEQAAIDSGLNPPAPPKLKINKQQIKGKWFDQAGNTIDSNNVTALRGFNPAWATWPNMEHSPAYGRFWETSSGFANSASFAYMYYRRDLAFGLDPCLYLFKRYKKKIIRDEQSKWVLGMVNRRLWAHGQALTNEIDGVTRDTSITDSLFGQIWGALTGNKNSSPSFKWEDYLEENKSLMNHPVAGTNNTAGVADNAIWMDSKHLVKNDLGIATSMFMLTRETADKALDNERDKNKKDEKSAVELFYANPYWGLVKAYYTYMAPMGEHEEKVLKDGEWVENKEFYKAYDPRTQEAQDKRIEVRGRNNSILNRSFNNIVYWNGKTGAFDVEYEVNGQEAYKDKYGNTKVEMFKDYRPGWVYTKRESNSIGEIVWVVPAKSMSKHEYAFDFAKTGSGFSLSKLTDSAYPKVTDVCTATKRGIVWGFFAGLFGIIGKIFGAPDYFINAYRHLPWVYTDATNAANAPTSNGLMNEEKFKYYPKGFLEELNFPLNTSTISYQEVPWKTNNNSSYLDFYEYMSKVEIEAKRYFFPELIEGMEAKKAGEFCNTKTKIIRAFGILKDRYFLEKENNETCKYCADLEADGTPKCNGLTPSEGKDPNVWDDGLGEVVGLKSMMGESRSPSEEYENVLLNASLSYVSDRPWSEYKANPSAYGGEVNVYEPTSHTSYNLRTHTPFPSLIRKFKWIDDRIKALTTLIDMDGATGRVIGDTALLIPFNSEASFVYPNDTDPNRVTYTYLKGEQVSNIQEIAELKRLSAEYLDYSTDSDTKRLSDISYNLNKMRGDFKLITQEPKYVNLSGVHKFSDKFINLSTNFFSTSPLGKQGSFVNRSGLAMEINKLVNLNKSAAKSLSNAALGGNTNPVGYLLASKNGQNLGDQDATNLPTRSPLGSEETSSVSNDTNKVDFLEQTVTANGSSSFLGQELFMTQYGVTGALTFVNLNGSYVNHSMDLVKKFMPSYSKIEWIFGKGYDKKSNFDTSEWFGGIENTSPENKQEVANLPEFYSFIKGDLLASYYMTSLSLSSWAHSALDVLLSYWTGSIGYSDCVWNLNRRLWPLINAMNEASPSIYVPKKKLDELKKNNAEYITALNNWGLFPTPNPTESRDFYQSLSFSQFDSNKNPMSPDEKWEHTNDDVLFAHRDNVLRLLFKFNRVTDILKPSMSLDQAQVENLIKRIAPAYVLSAHQHQANNTLLAYQDPNLLDRDATESDFIINSLCNSVAVSEATAGTLYRPYGRNRFETNNSFIMHAGVGNGYTYTGRVMGDDKVGANLYSYSTRTWASAFIGTHNSNWTTSSYNYFKGTTQKQTIDVVFPTPETTNSFDWHYPAADFKPEGTIGAE